MIDAIREAVAESVELKKTSFASNAERIAAVARQMCTALEGGCKVLPCGNGGSAADAQHIAAEFVGRFEKERGPLRALALTTDTSILTGIGNDYGCDRIFERQIQALGKPGDIAIAISTSGNSPNVLLAVQAANEAGLVTVGLTGKEGGKLGGIVGHHLHIAHHSTARVQEVYILMGQILCRLVDDHMKGV